MSDKEYIETELGTYFDCDEEYQAFDLPQQDPLPQSSSEDMTDVRDTLKSDQPDAD